MFIELTRKDGLMSAINVDQVNTFGPDTDGTGTMIIFADNKIRCVTEDYETVKSRVGLLKMAVKTAVKSSKKASNEKA